MIERHWKGICKNGRIGDYIDHLQHDTFPSLELIEGYVGSRLLTNESTNGTEVLVVTVWESIEAIRQFSEQPELAVVPDVVQEMMISFDQQVTHYEVKHEAYEEI